MPATLWFKQRYVEPIIRGEKTDTLRKPTAKWLPEGTPVYFSVGPRKPFALARVTACEVGEHPRQGTIVPAAKLGKPVGRNEVSLGVLIRAEGDAPQHRHEPLAALFTDVLGRALSRSLHLPESVEPAVSGDEPSGALVQDGHVHEAEAGYRGVQASQVMALRIPRGTAQPRERHVLDMGSVTGHPLLLLKPRTRPARRARRSA
jgi:hypothetical protein